MAGVDPYPGMAAGAFVTRAPWPRPGRVACCIPHCRRTAPKERHPDSSEIMCAGHWRMASKRARKLHNGRIRQADRMSALIASGALAGPASAQASDLCYNALCRSWDRVKREVVSSLGVIP